MYQNSEIKFGKNGNSFPVITDQKAEINFGKTDKTHVYNDCATDLNFSSALVNFTFGSSLLRFESCFLEKKKSQYLVQINQSSMCLRAHT